MTSDDADSLRLRERFRGCLLGGAIGDALGAGIEFARLDEIRRRYGPAGVDRYLVVYGRKGAITDDTQMTMFTAEALVRAEVIRRTRTTLNTAATASNRVVALHRGYLRWLHTQGIRSAHADYDDALDGWLIRLPELHSQRAPGNTCLGALQLAQPGSVSRPTNDSKGCGGVMRVAPVGLFGERPFDAGCWAAAITHGHPSGYLASGAFADVIARVVTGVPLHDAIAQMRATHADALSGEVLVAIDGAIAAAASGDVSAETVESLGGGWIAEEALAISLYCAMVARDFDHGVTLAVNHSGDSDSTGAITGNLLGAAWGIEAIDARWLGPLELREELEQLADDLLLARRGGPIDEARYPAH